MAADSPQIAPLSLSPSLRVALSERYEVVRETGSGGSATVYLARDLKHDRLVALKILNSDVGHTSGQRFLREIQVSAGMQHPHILPTYDSGVADGRLYFVMPFVDGGSLRDRLDAVDELPIEEALRCAHDIALALAFAHDQGVIHRDVKPENILFYHGHACLADFGIARMMEQLDNAVTQHGTLVGTPAYMSPEQVTEAGFDGRSDAYSLACVLYEMLAGSPPFPGATPQATIRERLRRPADSIRRHRAEVSPFVDALLAKALSVSPEARFPDAKSFASAIDSALRDLTAPPPRISGPKRVMQEPRLRRRWVASIAVLVGLGVLAWSPVGPREWLGKRGVFAAGTSPATAYAAGRRALEEWRLDVAERELGRAVAGDAQLATARLWLTEVLALERRGTTEEFRLSAARLAAALPRLRARDSLLAEGLVALGQGAPQRACSAYQRLRAADSLDALAWYGLGDCFSRDSAVVRDAASPSGWRFRTSWHAGAQAYARAALIDPGLHAALPFALMARLLSPDPSHLRFGRDVESPDRGFLAFPSLIADTVAYVPFPLADVAAGRPATMSATLPEALQFNRDRLLVFTRQWVSAAPNSAAAYEALALAREVRGELSSADDGAMGAVLHARQLASDPGMQLRLAAVSVRLFVKRGELERARTLADSIVAHAAENAATAGQLAGLAALTGHIERSARFRAIAAAARNADLGIAPPITEVASRLSVRAAAGVCDDTLRTLRRQVDGLLDSYSQPIRRPAMQREVLVQAMMLSFPCLGRQAFDGLQSSMPLDRAQRAFAGHQHARARSILDSLQGIRVGALPGDVTLDHTVQEAWLRAAIGDTAAAIHQLDLVLNALPTLGTTTTVDAEQAIALGRAFALCADLSSARGNRERAHECARNGLAIWRTADSPMAPIVKHLQQVVASAR